MLDPISLNGTQALTLADAAKRAGRSYAWAHDRASDGRLDIVQSSGSARIFVTAESLAREIGSIKTEARKRKPARLRLVVDNTK
jgi:hypothetical protein